MTPPPVEAAEARLAQEYHKLACIFHGHTVSKARALQRSTKLLESAMEELQARCQAEASLANTANAEFRGLCNDVEGLGDPEDWLSLMEARLQSVSSELEFADFQMSLARDNLEPA